ncbi:MAG: tRNA (N(6)-L-threonylcarbamoyladenosine(37)-C(2))-methylthiotransferase MtaB [Desulfosarcina sp.]
MKTFFIKTLGCKVNQCESEAIGNALLDSDPGLVCAAHGSADVVIVNTCTVTSKAAMQSRQAVRRAVRENPGARIVVTGCHAQVAAAELAAIPGVNQVVGNREKTRIPDAILGQADGCTADSAPAACPDSSAGEAFDPLPGIAHGSRTRPFLKIQDGCDAFCTYCIVPHARGRSRSLAVEPVLSQVRQLSRLGYHEVVLTGIHLGCYGRDLTPPLGLCDLLRRISDEGAIDRVRLSSIEPNELSGALIELAAVPDPLSGRLCAHFHIPLQSGDDAILKRMHRPYTGDQFRALVDRIIERLPDAAIGVDILVGFPGETDGAFEKTRALIRSLPVAYLHVFPFSGREGTPAFSFAGQIPPAVIQQRCRQLRRLGQAKRRAFYGRMVGKSVTVLVEGRRDRDDGRLKGLTDNYVPVRFEGPDALYNTFCAVHVDGLGPDGVEGRRAEGQGSRIRGAEDPSEGRRDED